MRIFSFCVFAAAAMAASHAWAQEQGWASSPEGKARWDACYKETRLILRTRNMSTTDYREIIKDARRSHMRDCMTRATPPAAVRIAVPTDRNPASALVSWAGSP